MTITYRDFLTKEVYVKKNLNQAEVLTLLALEGNQEIAILEMKEDSNFSTY